jgi:hypothetical protein
LPEYLGGNSVFTGYVYYGKNDVEKLYKMFTGANAKISEPPAESDIAVELIKNSG